MTAPNVDPNAQMMQGMLAQGLQAQQPMPAESDPMAQTPLEAEGTGSDTVIGHLTPGEVVVPLELISTPMARKRIESLFVQAGIDINQYTVGDRANQINPNSGYPMFDFWSDLRDDVLGIADDVFGFEEGNPVWEAEQAEKRAREEAEFMARERKKQAEANRRRAIENKRREVIKEKTADAKGLLDATRAVSDEEAKLLAQRKAKENLGVAGGFEDKAQEKATAKPKKGRKRKRVRNVQPRRPL